MLTKLKNYNMKKYLLGFMAVILAFSISAFTHRAKPTNDLYYWYRQSDHVFVGSSSSANENPLGCYGIGETCIKGYLRSSQPPSEPTEDADKKYAFN
jgi:hypothetical protein